MGIKISLLILMIVVSFSCGCVQETSQAKSNQSETTENNLKSTSSRFQPPMEGSIKSNSKNFSQGTFASSKNITWQTESLSCQEQLGWNSPEDGEKKARNTPKKSTNETRISTIRDFKVTRLTSE